MENEPALSVVEEPALNEEKSPALNEVKGLPLTLPMEPVLANSRWRVVGAAAPGTSHVRLGLPCQDALAYQAGEHGLLVALSDGAGTAERSQSGAQTAVQAALVSLTVSLDAYFPADQAAWQEALCAAFVDARSALQSLAEFEQQPLRAYAATLILVVATSSQLAVAQLGDGAVVAGESPDQLFLVNLPQRGEYANETYFLTQEDALEHVQVSVHAKAVTSLAVMSDGLTRLALRLPAHEPHLPFFQPLFAFTAHADEEQEATGRLLEFLNSERVCNRTDDDKSLVLAVRPSDLELGPQGETSEQSK
jgi:hypothetical protein